MSALILPWQSHRPIDSARRRNGESKEPFQERALKISDVRVLD